MKELLINHEQMYRLVDDGKGLILEVVAGGIAMYWVRVRLNAEERERFDQEGASFIEELARKILHDPPSYAERTLFEPPIVD